jgi:hypothetical protein
MERGASYESLLQIVSRLQRAASRDDRYVTWCTGEPPLGVARDLDGSLEIFVEADEINARSRIVQENLEYQEWFRSGGEPFRANRLVLPSSAHFDKAAAFICTELLDAGISSAPHHAFQMTEPLIEVWFERIRISNESILGLAGELLVLDAVARYSAPENLAELLESWKGYRRSSRDFQYGLVGVEVKTTTGVTSSHVFSGVEQLEPGHGVDGVDEDSLLLVSVGLEWVDSSSLDAWTLPKLVESIARTVGAGTGSNFQALYSQFLSRVRLYGSDPAVGYDHSTMSELVAFNKPFHIRFIRSYDMSDDAIKVFRTPDLREKPNVQTDSLRFRANFPNRVSGDINPVHGVEPLARDIVRRASGLA